MLSLETCKSTSAVTRYPAPLCAGYSKLPNRPEHAWCHSCPQHKHPWQPLQHTLIHTLVAWVTLAALDTRRCLQQGTIVMLDSKNSTEASVGVNVAPLTHKKRLLSTRFCAALKCQRNQNTLFRPFGHLLSEAWHFVAGQNGSAGFFVCMMEEQNENRHLRSGGSSFLAGWRNR